MKPTRMAALALLALICAAPLRAADKSAIAAELNRAYDGKTVALQKFYDGETLHYSATGDFEKGGSSGPWTLDAYIKIKRVRFKGKDLLFDGDRVYFVFSTSDREFNAGLGRKVAVAIKTDPASMSIASIAKALSKAFIGSDQKLADFVPDYWKPILLHPGASQFELCVGWRSLSPIAKDESPSDIRKSCTAPTPSPQLGIPVEGTSLPPQGTPGTTPPVALSDPPPPLTPEARALRMHGTVILLTVIDTHGHVSDVRLLEPLGMGLDDEAVATVRKWKFKPTTRDGKPVVVTALIHVHFVY